MNNNRDLLDFCHTGCNVTQMYLLILSKSVHSYFNIHYFTDINLIIKAIMWSFIKNYMLVFAMILGVATYFIYNLCPIFDLTRPYALKAVAIIQPILIFSMLFLSFCKIDAKQLRPRKSHLILLTFQCGIFGLLSFLIHCFPNVSGRLLIESALLLFICPTATAATVVTQKLKGDGADITMYTVLINMMVAIIVPICVPLMYPHEGENFIVSFQMIMGKVFPLLICPLLAAMFVRYYLPKIHRWFLSFRNMAFNLWAIALSIAIAVTTRSIMHSHYSISILLGICIVSLLTCVVQFALGRYIGCRVGRPVSTCQSLGQKNTVFAIWMGYTFLDPITSIAGGFYSIWHNVYNTYQLRQQQRTNIR